MLARNSGLGCFSAWPGAAMHRLCKEPMCISKIGDQSVSVKCYWLLLGVSWFLMPKALKSKEATFFQNVVLLGMSRNNTKKSFLGLDISVCAQRKSSCFFLHFFNLPKISVTCSFLFHKVCLLLVIRSLLPELLGNVTVFLPCLWRMMSLTVPWIQFS